jgi:hypothetical protein
VDPAQFTEGASQAFEALRTVGRDREGVGRIASGDFMRAANTPHPVAEALRTDIGKPMAWAGNMVDRMTQGGGVRRLVDALASPQGAQDLIELSRYSRGSVAATRILQQILGVNAANQTGR